MLRHFFFIYGILGLILSGENLLKDFILLVLDMVSTEKVCGKVLNQGTRIIIYMFNWWECTIG